MRIQKGVVRLLCCSKKIIAVWCAVLLSFSVPQVRNSDLRHAYAADPTVTENMDQDMLYQAVYNNNLEYRNAEPSDQATLNSLLNIKVSESIRNQTSEIIQGCSTDLQKLQAIHDWIADTIYYDNYGLQNGSVVVEAKQVLSKKGTVCAGYSNLTAAMCAAAGIPCKIVNGFALGKGTAGYWSEDTVNSTIINHAWNEAYVDDRWVIMDVTWDSQNENTSDNPEPQYRTSRQKYFDISLENLSLNHKLISDSYYNMDINENRVTDPNLNLKISVDDHDIMFDWNLVEGGMEYAVLYKAFAEEEVFGIGCRKGNMSCTDVNVVPHFQENKNWYGESPVYFCVRVIKADGTVRYSPVIEYNPNKPELYPVEKTTVMPGDLNGDSQVNSTDVILLRRFIAGGYSVSINEDAADVNADGMLNSSDVILIRRYIAGGYGVELK